MPVENCVGCMGVIPENPRHSDSEAIEAFAQISALGKDLFYQQVRAVKGQSLPGGLPTEKVSLGKISTNEGIRVEVVYGSFNFTQRSLVEAGQPRVFGSTDGWVLAVREESSPRFRPIAYEADFSDLPVRLKRPLLERIKNVQQARQRVNGQVA